MNTDYKVDDKVRLLVDIWDDGCDNHHPPCYLAMKGEILIVRSIPICSKDTLNISHEHITDNYFYVFTKEVEKVI